MTLKELNNKTSIGICILGTFDVVINYRGKEYTCTSHNTLAYDVACAWRKGDDTLGSSYYTPKQAFQALYDEAKHFNHL